MRAVYVDYDMETKVNERPTQDAYGHSEQRYAKRPPTVSLPVRGHIIDS